MGDFNVDGTVVIEYDIAKNKFTTTSDINEPKEIVELWLRQQIGAGKDNSPVAQHDVYRIEILCDFSYDKMNCVHNCENKGLRDGILLHYLNNG